jgi:hypothetical protein
MRRSDIITVWELHTTLPGAHISPLRASKLDMCINDSIPEPIGILGDEVTTLDYVHLNLSSVSVQKAPQPDQIQQHLKGQAHQQAYKGKRPEQTDVSPSNILMPLGT